VKGGVSQTLVRANQLRNDLRWRLISVAVGLLIRDRRRGRRYPVDGKVGRWSRVRDKEGDMLGGVSPRRGVLCPFPTAEAWSFASVPV
jgi:hypothetical protein